MTNYPENDSDFQDKTITDVNSEGCIQTDGLWLLVVPSDSPIKAKVGMSARFYPKDNIGRPIRGLFIDGVKVYYRTKAEDEDHREIELYGANAADWLKRWDDGRPVWTIEMGGLGPGYEQCIHITAAEILRHFLRQNHDHSLWQDKDIWRQVRDETDKVLFASPVIKELGLSGAQAGAAYSIASALYMQGPRAIMNDPQVKDRHIQVRKHFPQAA